jgi:hypothetical protein
LGVIYKQWSGVLWRRQVLLSCKLINKCFEKSISFWTDHVLPLHGFSLSNATYSWISMA